MIPYTFILSLNKVFEIESFKSLQFPKVKISVLSWFILEPEFSLYSLVSVFKAVYDFFIFDDDYCVVCMLK